MSGKRSVMEAMVLVLVVLFTLVGFAYAKPVTVAVFNFESKAPDKTQDAEKAKGPETADLGKNIADLIIAELSTNPGFELVERERLDAILEELKLSLAGVIDEGQAAKVGKIAGAQVLVVGRAFTLDKELIIVSKIIGTETSRVYGEIVKGPLTGKLAPIAKKLSSKIANTISRKGDTLLAKEPMSKEEKIKAICKKIEKKKLPLVSISIPERHFGTPAVDPAVESEMTYFLTKCGFKVLEGEKETLSDWAKEYLKDANISPPRTKVDVIIVGEAFSEFGTRIKDLVSCKGRAEIKAIDTRTGAVLSIDRETGVAVDLSEQIASKKALQKAAENIASRFIVELVNAWDSQE